MHPFSIDFITRDPSNADVLDYKQCERLSPTKMRLPTKQTADSFRQTPSPTDSGMASDSSPSQNEMVDIVAEAISTLEKRVPREPVTRQTSDEKPPHSYIALISMAILSNREKKMLLCDIYQYIMDNFSYYKNDEKAWRNSIRHNLSLNECFVKNGRADNGKGNYWSIHPACEDDFAKGDFRRRQARRRARKSVKEIGTSEVGMPYRYNIGYVPMTASHIGYHPYGQTTSSLLYPQQPSSYPAITSPLTASTTNLTSRSAQLPLGFAQSDLSPSGYLPSPMSSSSQNYPFSNAAAVAAHRLFSEQTSSAFGEQAFQSNHLPSGLHSQNW